jgi:hypothetical protein
MINVKIFFYIIFILLLLSCKTIANDDIEVFRMEKFPKDKLALHMPCIESNMFATKCMCHLKCTSPNCDNAKKICDKYKDKGCKYMLLRGQGIKMIATLKRIPSKDELKSFDISMYPKSISSFEIWKKKNNIQTKFNIKNILINNIINKKKHNIIINNLLKDQTTINHPYCGNIYKNNDNSTNNKWKKEFTSKSFGLAALNYHTPLSLVNSMRTWNKTGFLDMMNEKIVILNDPYVEEIAMSLHHGFNILEPRNIPNVKMTKPNIVTIGAAFYYALKAIESEYIIFLEKDFKMDITLTEEQIKTQLITAAGMLDRGAEVIRLMSRKYQGCGTFKDCEHGGIKLKSEEMIERKRNWYSFYCKDKKDTENSVSDCTSYPLPLYRCFTSYDSNWSLNAVMVKKSTMLNKKYKSVNGLKSIAEIGLQNWQNQDGFETVMIYTHKWGHWKVPICISYEGLFIHEQIETSY